MKSEQQQLAEAIALFRQFNSRAPREENKDIIRVTGLGEPTIALKVGPFIGIAYRALDGTEYMHYFENRRPFVYVNSDGDQIYILEGGYRFTRRGFIG